MNDRKNFNKQIKLTLSIPQHTDNINILVSKTLLIYNIIILKYLDS